jgi:hypothetical protein
MFFGGVIGDLNTSRSLDTHYRDLNTSRFSGDLNTSRSKPLGHCKGSERERERARESERERPSLRPPTHPSSHPPIPPANHRKKPWSKAWRQDLSKKNSFNKTELQTNSSTKRNYKTELTSSNNYSGLTIDVEAGIVTKEKF